MNFVHGTSSEEEKELQFSRHTNEEFYAQKKQQQHAKDVSKKTCFKCDLIGYVGHTCPNLKIVDVEKKKKVEVEKQKSNKFESKQTWKPKTPKVVTQRIWKQKVDVSEPKQIWKPKNDLSK
ncbi:hypothetical protein Hanom_Chr03g00211561 [Helianthus anomalus]